MPAADFREIMLANRQRDEGPQAGQRTRLQKLQKLLRMDKGDTDSTRRPPGHKPSPHDEARRGPQDRHDRERHPGVGDRGREERAAKA